MSSNKVESYSHASTSRESQAQPRVGHEGGLCGALRRFCNAGLMPSCSCNLKAVPSHHGYLQWAFCNAAPTECCQIITRVKRRPPPFIAVPIFLAIPCLVAAAESLGCCHTIISMQMIASFHRFANFGVSPETGSSCKAQEHDAAHSLVSKGC